MAFLRKTTPGGYRMDEVYSSLQKSCRRGLIDDAVYWARQLAPWPNALKRRIVLFALEDMPYPDLIIRVEREKAELDALLPWVVVLCEVPKTHVSAWLNRLSPEEIARPGSFSFDGEMDDALTGALSFTKTQLDEDEKVRYLAGKCWLTSCAPELLKVYAYTRSPLVGTVVAVQRLIAAVAPKTFMLKSSAVIDTLGIEPREIPDWALDKHTGRGAAMGRGYAFFFSSGMMMQPKLFETDPFSVEGMAIYTKGGVKTRVALDEARVATKEANVATKEARVATKDSQLPSATPPRRFGQGVRGTMDAFVVRTRREPRDEITAGAIGKYTLIVQAQLITARYKPRVFYARDGENPVVIKGPINRADMAKQLESERVKIALGLRHGNMRVETIDGFSYLVSDMLAPRPHGVVERESKIEGVVRVAATNARCWKHEMMVENDRRAVSVLVALAFRKCIGANDTTPRNILLTDDDEAASIDDAAHWKPTPYMWEVANKNAGYPTFIRHYFNAVCSVIKTWNAETLDLNEEKRRYFSEQRDKLLLIDGWVFY